MGGHTLNYIRIATKQRDGKNGFLYFHSWDTGFQELIFATHHEATKFKLANGIQDG